MDATALLCNICPKQPKFSDVSHLLTHIASKAHLSHYFKLQVRSHQEPQAEVLLDDYNHWYKTNNLAKLLSDRMSSKDSRRKKSQGKYAVLDNVGQAGQTEKGEEYKAAPLPVCGSGNNLPDYIDPRLSDPFINPDTDIGHTRVPNPLSGDHPVNCIHRQWKLDNEDDSGEEETHTSPCLPKGFCCGGNHEAPPLNGSLIYDPFVDDNDSFEYSNASDIDKERADEIARLKGVLWPGMDIFDSATEQMKRKRNQKKDESILKMMERTSMGVEPTELVFSPTGVLRKQRVISGNVEDSSPLKGETPIPKKRAPRPKRVLSQMDPNAQRGPDGKRARKNIKRDGDSLGDIDHRDLFSPRREMFQAPGGLGGQISIGDGMGEYDLALHSHDFRPHNKLAVFRDVAALREFQPENQTKCLHGGLTTSQARSVQRDLTIQDNSHSPHAPIHSSASLEKGPQSIVDKENIEPLLNVYGRIDPLVGWHSPAMKRADRGLSPQYLFGDVQYVGYSPFECHESPTGYSFNPLAGSLSKTAAEENPIFSAEPGHVLKAPPATRASSPDATISEVEDDDFDRLYLDESSC
ncbi:uncharacterized protein BJX67DRAFT_386418 [Aspergillus lucknowensis]|uniref:Uncharacterized protein n=1 Tax=Aspergillus lucknowensis TaxID=176173 RepID=A0ABR4L814_9EURO